MLASSSRLLSTVVTHSVFRTGMEQRWSTLPFQTCPVYMSRCPDTVLASVTNITAVQPPEALLLAHLLAHDLPTPFFPVLSILLAPMFPTYTELT